MRPSLSWGISTKTSVSSPSRKSASRGMVRAWRGGAATLTTSYISGLKRPFWFFSTQRTLAVRRTGSTVSEIQSTRPRKVRPG